jgi:hypothetical protein
MSADSAGDEEQLFRQAIDEALDDAVVQKWLGPLLTAKDLREYLSEKREELSGAVAAERQRWQQAEQNSQKPSDLLRGREEVTRRRWLRIIAWIFVIPALLSAAFGLVGLIRSPLDAARIIRPTAGLGTSGDLISGLVGLVLASILFVIAGFFFGVGGDAARRQAVKNLRAESQREALAARNSYSAALNGQVLEQATFKINDVSAKARARIFDLTLRVEDASRLGVYDKGRLRVPCEADRYLDVMLNQLPGFAVGVAGPRGVGKTSLVSRYCPAGTYVREDSQDLTVLATAPVEYTPQEFVQFLFESVCQAYTAYYAKQMKEYRDAIAIAAELRQLQTATLTQAAENLDRLRYQRSRNWTSGANLSLPSAVASFSRQFGLTRTEASLTYPALVSEFRKFLENAASVVSGNGGRVFIGVDELDKIGDADQAQRFVNELKAILGVPKCYYLITLSDDALASYEMRGLPVRDAFDSAFDEVIHVGYLRLEESRLLLSRYVSIIPIAFICLCHSLSGGLPRDLIRTARHAVTVARQDTSGKSSGHITRVCEQLILDEVASRLHATSVKLARQHLSTAEAEFLNQVQRIISGQAGPEVRESLTSLRQPDEDTEGRGNAEAVATITGFAAYLKFLGILLDVFSDQLDIFQYQPSSDPEEPIIPARASIIFEALCHIRQLISTNTNQAMLAMDAFRSGSPAR